MEIEECEPRISDLIPIGTTMDYNEQKKSLYQNDNSLLFGLDGLCTKPSSKIYNIIEENDIILPYFEKKHNIAALSNQQIFVAEEKSFVDANNKMVASLDEKDLKRIDEIFDEADEEEEEEEEEEKEELCDEKENLSPGDLIKKIIDSDEKEADRTWTKDDVESESESDDSAIHILTSISESTDENEVGDITGDGISLNLSYDITDSLEKERSLAWQFHRGDEAEVNLTPELNLLNLKHASIRREEDLSTRFKVNVLHSKEKECKTTPRRKTTKPKEFKFATDGRVRRTLIPCTDSEKPFETRLRRDLISPNYSPRPTLPTPFKFTISPRKLFGGKKEKVETFAESLLKFETKPPTRYVKQTSDPDSTLVPEKPPQPPSKFKTTVPVSPKLRTKERIREKKVVSAKDMEEKVVEKMKSYQFKAREINKKMVEMKGMYGVKEIPVTSYTEVKGFDFEVDRRIEHRKKSADRKTGEKDEKNSSSGRKSADLSKRTRLTPTKVKAFSFETRDKERYTKKEERIKNYKLNEEKFHEFHARPLPTLSPNLPAVLVKKTTKPQPFKLSGGSPSYHSKLEEKLKLEEEKEKAKRQFKAHPANVVKKEPFHPITGQHSPTNTVNIILHSEVRAKQRAEYELTKDEKEKRLAEETSRIEKEKQQQDEEQMRQLRRKLVHKASPIRTFKSIEILKSNVPVTIPKAPNFHVERRAKSRAGSCSLYT